MKLKEVVFELLPDGATKVTPVLFGSRGRRVTRTDLAETADVPGAAVIKVLEKVRPAKV